MLRIDRVSNGRVVLSLSGAISGGDVVELERFIQAEQNGKPLALDLKHVTSVDWPAVRLLGCCRQAGTALENCPPYIRDWVARELEAGEK